jgi:hypothetical protein
MRVAAGICLLVGGALLGQPVSPKAAPEPPRFRWQVGQTLRYQVSQQTTVQETYRDQQQQLQTQQISNDLRLTRQWTVQAVSDEIATVEMRILAMRMELRRAKEEPIIRDSAQPEHARELTDYLDKAILTARIDGLGRLLSVKATSSWPTQRLEAEPPFRLVLPEQKRAPGESWARTTAVRVDPPLGVGDSYQLEQKYTLLRQEGSRWTVGLTTRWRGDPPSTEQLALLTYLWQGELYFDIQAGRYLGARLQIKQQIRDHAGPGSCYLYQSQCEETLQSEPPLPSP